MTSDRGPGGRRGRGGGASLLDLQLDRGVEVGGAEVPAPAKAEARQLPALEDEALQADLRQLAAVYLIGQTPLPGGDPVARFHLDNGARLERLNPGGDRSAKGLKQSHGMMVNYLYDLDRIEEHHEAFTQGEIATARAVSGLL